MLLKTRQISNTSVRYNKCIPTIRSGIFYFPVDYLKTHRTITALVVWYGYENWSLRLRGMK
jgi:hypothetical protein